MVAMEVVRWPGLQPTPVRKYTGRHILSVVIAAGLNSPLWWRDPPAVAIGIVRWSGIQPALVM